MAKPKSTPKKTIRKLKSTPKPKKDTKILLPLTSEQKLDWQQRATDANYKSLTPFIRDCVEKSKIYVNLPAPPINEETYIELNKIGTNLNQITRRINEAVKIGLPITDNPTALIKELQSQIKEVQLQLLGLSHTGNDDW
ncbi:MAG: MobC family plasmid mobilization relaxosome protein [Scytonematopsis contorta HA4267-MV1]|jgi:Ser-tRNA(Ala) deacylase AlaX|nr:MobC family plasmid mobilization relaxosome protein [Scytonematopsis contorta HA4267-MV1]